jgi:hypothetical protein
MNRSILRRAQNFAAGLLLACGLFVASSPAWAVGASMCVNAVSGAAEGPRTIGGTNSAVPSGTVYILNGQGCGYFKSADVGYFLSQGFTFAGNYGVAFFNVPVAATGTTSYQVATIPANAAIIGFGATNTDATHAVTGGMTCGSASAGTQYMSTALLIPVATSATVPVSVMSGPAVILVGLAATASATQPVWCEAVTSWNTPTTVTIATYYMLF